jgi:hypothetical protein
MLLMKNLFETDEIINLHFLELRDYFVSHGKCIGEIRLDRGIYEYKIMDKCDGTLNDYIGELRQLITLNPYMYIRKSKPQGDGKASLVLSLKSSKATVQ